MAGIMHGDETYSDEYKSDNCDGHHTIDEEITENDDGRSDDSDREIMYDMGGNCGRQSRWQRW